MNDTRSQSQKGGEAVKAALLSAFVLPGAGQIYNRQWIKGIVVGIFFLVASLSVLIPLTLVVVGYYTAIGSGNLDEVQQPLQSLYDMMWSLLVLIIASIVLYIYSIVDAYKQRQKMDS